MEKINECKAELNISFRKATIDDLDFVFYTKKEALYKYIVKIWGWDEDIQYKWLQLSYKPENISIIIFKGRDIGLLEVEKEINHIDLINIEILKKYRNLGLGTKIISDIIGNSDSAERISLRVFKDNSRAIKLYKRLGFVKFGSTEYHDLYEVCN